MVLRTRGDPDVVVVIPWPPGRPGHTKPLERQVASSAGFAADCHPAQFVR